MKHRAGTVAWLAQLWEASHRATTLEDGSAGQIDASNEFGELLQKRLTPAAFRKWEQYALKATTKEMVDYGWKLLDQPGSKR